MGAAELLNCLRGDGLVLTLIAGGGIHAAPRDALTDQHRAAIRAARDALVLVLQAEASCQTPTPTPPSIAIPPSTRRSGNPLMTPKQSGDCHADGWSDTEIKVFMMREARFIRLGRVAKRDRNEGVLPQIPSNAGQATSSVEKAMASLCSSRSSAAM